MQRYLVYLLRRPDYDPAVVAEHLAWLAQQRAQGRVELSGGFGDKSGGAYLLRAGSLAEAGQWVASDPAQRSGGWDVRVHEWQAE
ncbi:MAG TPA: YciI family protein [Rhodanobacteraceae bacterium]|nr:YciI family protein [Rhodanobacteraceae bacterium]